MDHFDEWRYAVQGQLFQDLSRETWTFRNDMQGRRAAGPPVRAPGCQATAWAARWCTGTASCGVSCDYFFEYRSHLEQRYGKGFLPEDTTIQDWGITYDELEPYYTQFDKTFGIAGKAGNMQGSDSAGRQPVRGAALRGVPTATQPDRVRANAVQAGLRAARLQDLPPTDRQQPGDLYAIRMARCWRRATTAASASASAATSGAKASPITTVIPSALASGRVEIREYCNVFRINTDGGRVTGVSYYDADGRGAGAARRSGRAGRLHPEQHPLAAAVADRPAIRSAGEHGRGRSQLHLPDRRRRAQSAGTTTGF